MTTSARSSREIVDELIAGWDSTITSDGYGVSPRGTGARAGRHRTDAQTVLMGAYGSHVHNTARLLVEYLPDRLTVAHMPLIRSIYETTLTLVWVDEVDDSAEALMTEESRQRRNIAKDLGELGQYDLVQIPHQDMALDSSSIRQGRHFEQLAKDIALGNAYVTYRVLSGLSHPSIQVADAYTGMREDGNVFLRSGGKPLAHGSDDGWGRLVAMCLVWSGFAVNYLDPNRTRRSELRHVARELGIPAALSIRAEAISRVNRERRERR